MPFLDYFRCCCCKKPPITPPPTPREVQIHKKHPTMVSYDFDSAKGQRRAFHDLPDLPEEGRKTIPPRDAPRAS